MENVIGGFHISEPTNNTEHFVLHEIPEDIIQRDIEAYCRSKFASMCNGVLPQPRPSAEDITSLVQQVNGLFIFAATAVKSSEDTDAADPQGQLASLLLQ